MRWRKPCCRKLLSPSVVNVVCFAQMRTINAKIAPGGGVMVEPQDRLQDWQLSPSHEIGYARPKSPPRPSPIGLWPPA